MPVFLTVLYLGDIGIYKQFNTRLYFAEISRYGAELEPVISQALVTTGSGWILFIAGLLAPALVPLIVVSSKLALPRGKVATPLQQSDVFNSIMYLVSSSYCTASNKRNLFKPDGRERMLFHRRGDFRDRVNVFYGKGRGVVKLDGDNTGFFQSVDMSELKQLQVVNYINHMRIEGDKRQRKALAKGVVPYQ